MFNQPLEEEKRKSIFEKQLNEEWVTKLLELQGQCRIKEVTYLKFNPLKAVVLTALLIISVVGLFLLKYSQKIRTKVFFSSLAKDEINSATHIYVKGHQGQEQISRVVRKQYQSEERAVFQFKKLKYEVYEERPLPLGFNFIDKISELRAESFLTEGLPLEEVFERQQFYGKNEHQVEVPNYPQYLFDTMTQPFFIFQYIVSLKYILEKQELFAVFMVAFAFLTTSINYVLLNRSYNKIKETAQKLFKVKVLRNGKYEQIDNIDIVPGDLYEPSKEIPCDSIVVKGELFVDEVKLTGENVPIAKSRILDNSKHSDRSHWLFEGSKLQTMKENTLALAVNVGYASQRGRIIRKILNRTSKQPQFLMKLIYFQLEVLMVSMVIYLVTLPDLISQDVDDMSIIFRLLDFIADSIPTTFPIFFNLAYSFCLLRLNGNDIIGTQAQKTVEGARMMTVCFDKTGTLTFNKMSVLNVYSFESNQITDITQQIVQNTLILSLFASCNSVEAIEGQVKGDQIDLRMFEFAQAKFCPSHSEGVIRSIILNGRTLQVLKIHQYESQFQSMSVLVRDSQTQRIYVFAKGSPQLIHHYSARKVHGFEKLIKDLSFKGLRSIGFGFREVSKAQLQRQLLKGREQCLMDTTILGVVTFVNLLKEDARLTVNTLTECEINTKIITGDNIFLGVQTAIAVGMIPKHSKVTVLEGSKYSKATNSIQALRLTQNENGSIQEHYKKIESFVYQNEPNHFYAIDNDFIRENPEGFMHEKVKVFARTSPQGKALIIKKHKELIIQQESHLTIIQKILSDCSLKIGMIGDGANDLMAIKQAHVGIGIKSSDAVLSATFVIKDLCQVLDIIKQSKNTQRQIMEMVRYFGIAQFGYISMALIQTHQLTFFTSTQLFYTAFMNLLTITLTMGLSKPAKSMSKHLNSSNMIDLKNHLEYWLTTIVYLISFLTVNIYYINSGDFITNPFRKTYFYEPQYGNNQSNTINFIIFNIFSILLPLAIYQSQPWKAEIWKNYVLSFIIILNIITIFFISFFTQHFSWLDIVKIQKKHIVVFWVIMLIAFLIAKILNILIQRCFHEWRCEQLHSDCYPQKDNRVIDQID